MRNIICLIMALIISVSLISCKKDGSSAVNEGTPQLVLDTWSPDVKSAVNDLITLYGKDGEEYEKDSYVVLDFDNTCTIFDIQDQLIIYQLEHMAFSSEMDPEKLEEVLLAGLSDQHKKRGTEYCEKDSSYLDWVTDIVSAYTILDEDFGPFSPTGMTEEQMEVIRETPDWREFATKMRAMFDLVYDNEKPEVAYPWFQGIFTGMTKDELYVLSKASCEYYMEEETEIERWTSPKSYRSKTGITSYKWTSGVSIPDNIYELMTALKNNGIRVWIASSSATDVVKAAIDVWDLHEYVDGVIGMTMKTEKGRFLNEYDYDNGVPEMTAGDKWKEMKTPTKALIYGEGKVDAIKNILVKGYKQGPLAGFMDTTGDYNFCTEFSSMKLVCCVNRGNRKVTDGGAVIAELAMYQKDVLGYDLAKALEKGDTFYVLQGRDENGLRSFRSNNSTIPVNSEEEVLFRSYGEDEQDLNQMEYDYMVKNKMTTREIVDLFAMYMDARDPKNTLGFTYGFFEEGEFKGYHSIK